MIFRFEAKIIKGLGGLYALRASNDGVKQLAQHGIFTDTVFCKGKGAFRHEGKLLLAGDNVTVKADSDFLREPDANGKDEAMPGVMIEEILPRKNELIRPPMSNLDIILAVAAVKKPYPVRSTLDKLITAAEFKKIEPVVILTKADLDSQKAKEIAAVYEKCGFVTFIEGTDSDITPLKNYIIAKSDKTIAFAGASGVGKSTLINRLFPALQLSTGEISRKNERGKHTTRHIELFPLSKQFNGATGYLADTPGFSMIDLEQFDFYTKDDLPYVFREFANYIGKCRYTKCTHTKEEGCAILDAVANGEIPNERHLSYLEFYNTLKDKHKWTKK